MAKVLQLKISLNGSKPNIWRRFLVKDDITFYELHEVIQDVMGWNNYHLFMFEVAGLELGIVENDYDEWDDAEDYVLNKLLKEGGSFKYEYDFGDCWMHTVKVEKVLDIEDGQKYPVVLKGKMACPLEDVGGIWGYKEFLEIISDKNHPEYETYNEWSGGDFDAKAFDLEEINERLQG